MTEGNGDTARLVQPAGPPEGRRARKRAEIRARLLDAGQAIFVRRGVEEATIAQITEAAGVGFGTFYLYFPTKEALYKALVARGFAALGRELDALRQRAQTTGESWEATLQAGVSIFFRFAEANQDLLLLMFAGRETGEGAFGGELRAQVIEWARAMVRTALQTARLDDQTALAEVQDLLVVTVIVLLRRSTVWWLRGEGGRTGAEDLPVETISAAIGRYIAAGITAALHPEHAGAPPAPSPHG